MSCDSLLYTFGKKSLIWYTVWIFCGPDSETLTSNSPWTSWIESRKRGDKAGRSPSNTKEFRKIFVGKKLFFPLRIISIVSEKNVFKIWMNVYLFIYFIFLFICLVEPITFLEMFKIVFFFWKPIFFLNLIISGKKIIKKNVHFWLESLQSAYR